MKKVSMRFLFSFIAISAILALFSCQGNGKKVNPPNTPSIPSTPGNHGSKIEKVILKFDSKKIIVKNVTAGIDMTEGSEVKVGTKLKFDTASDALDKNKVFDGFRINKDKKSVDKNEVYVVDASHVARHEGKNILEITFVEREKTQEKVKITFASNVKATKKIGQNSASIQSGDSAQDGEEFTFEATVAEGKILDSWFVNDVAKQTGNDRDKFTYTVNTSHAKEKNGSKEIEVKFTEKDVKKVTLQYEEDKFERFEYKDKNNNWKSLAQNEEVQTGLYIRFEIKQALIKQGKIVDYFTINGAKTDKVQRSSGECLYEVDDKDGKEQDGNSVIKIGVVMKEAKNAKLKFNEEEIVIVQGGNGPGDEVIKKNGDDILEGAKIWCSLKDQEKKAQEWLCNGKPVGNPGNVIFFTVAKEHIKKEGNEAVVHITVKTAKKEKLKIKFADTITCKYYRPQGQSISSGDSVQDGDELYFIANVSGKKVVDSWFINDIAKPSSQQNMLLYTVKASDAKEKNGSKEIEVKFTEKDVKKVTMQYEEDKIGKMYGAIENEPPIEINQEEEISANFIVWFVLKSELIKQGKAVDYFTINEERTDKIQLKDNVYIYKVDENDAKKQDGKLIIKIGAVLKEARSVKLQFNEEAIIVWEKVGEGAGSEIERHNGDEVSEGAVLFMYVKDENKKFQQVLCNGKNVNYDFTRSFCLVSNEYIEKQGNDYVLNITVKLVEKEKIKIKFDEAIISCVNRYDESKKINSNTLVNERMGLLFKAKKRDDQVFKHWLIGNREEKGRSEKDNTGKLLHVFDYDVKLNHAVNGEIEVKCILIDRLKCTLLLPQNSIEAGIAKLDEDGNFLDWKEVQHNAEISVGDKLSIGINMVESKVVDKWLINGKDAEESEESIYIGTDKKYIEFELTKEFVKTENGKNVLSVICVFKEPKEIKIEFDDTKLECMSFDNENGGKVVNNGDKVKEGYLIQFASKKGVFVGKWKLNGKEMKFDSLRGEIAFKLSETHYVKNGDDFVMSVSIEEREALPIAVEFDPDKVECKKKDTQEVVQPGTKILEDTELTFTAKDVQGIDRIIWYMGDLVVHPSPSVDPFFLTSRANQFTYREETKDYVIRVRWIKAN